MNQGIKMSNCKFYVNEATRTVVCVIPNTSELLFNFIREHFRWNDVDMLYAIDWHLEKELRMPRSFIGKAVCAEEDEWNEATGRLIAFARAKDKCYKSFFRRANFLIQTLDRRLGDMITDLNNFGMRLDARREQLQEKIDHKLDKKE